METNLPVIEKDFTLELCLLPWSTLTKADVNPKDLQTAGKVAKLLLTSKRYEALDNFVLSLPADVRNAFLEDETFRRVLIQLRYKQEHFEDACNLIRSGKFSEKADLIDIWDEAHYHMWMKKHPDKGLRTDSNTGLTTLQKFRIRKRNPPPLSICPSGRHSRSLDEKVRALLSSWFQENAHAPYPSKRDREEIAQKTGLTDVQIRNWFSNARRRAKRRGPQQPSRRKTYGQKCRHDKDHEHPPPIIIPSVSDVFTQSQAISQEESKISSQPPGLQGLLLMYQQLVKGKNSVLRPFATTASSTKQSNDTTAYNSSIIHHSPAHATYASECPTQATEIPEHSNHVTDVAEHPLCATDHPTHVTAGSERSVHATDASGDPKHVTERPDRPNHVTEAPEHLLRATYATCATDHTEHRTLVTDTSEHPVHATDASGHPTHATDASGHPTHATDGAEAVPEGITLWSAPCITTQLPGFDPAHPSSVRMPRPLGLQLPFCFVPYYQQSGFPGHWRHLCVSSSLPSSRSEPAFVQQMASPCGNPWIVSMVPSAPEAVHFPRHFTGLACSSGVVSQKCPSPSYFEPSSAAMTRESPVQVFVSQQDRGNKDHENSFTKLSFGSPRAATILSTTTDIFSPTFSSPEPLFSPLFAPSSNSLQEPPSLDGSSPQQEAPFSVAETAVDVESPFAGPGNCFQPDLSLQASTAALPPTHLLSSEAKSCKPGAEVVSSDHRKALPVTRPQSSETKRKQAEELAAHILLNMAAT